MGLKINMAKKIKSIWEATDVKTGRQITLWIISLVTMVVFSNNVLSWWSNFIENPGLVGIFNLLTFFVFRVLLGYLFD